MRVLITGGAGYIGSFAARRFLAAGHEVLVYDNLSVGHREAVPDVRLVVGELANAALLGRVLSKNRIDAVVHFAARTLVGESVRDPARYYHTNFACTLGLMDLMRQHGVERFVFSSTCATYGIPDRVPLTEDEPQKPINPYGNSKLAVEMALRDHARAYGWGVALLRYFNAAGASPDGRFGEDHDPETHLIPLVIQAALGQRPRIDVFGTDYPTPDGTCVRDYVHVEDLAEAHLLALERLRPSEELICNLGTGKGYSVREVIRSVEDVSGRKVPVQEAARRPGDPPALVASAERARRLLGWVPRYGELHAITQTAWAWHSSYPQGYKGRAAA